MFSMVVPWSESRLIVRRKGARRSALRPNAREKRGCWAIRFIPQRNRSGRHATCHIVDALQECEMTSRRKACERIEFCLLLGSTRRVGSAERNRSADKLSDKARARRCGCPVCIVISVHRRFVPASPSLANSFDGLRRLDRPWRFARTRRRFGHCLVLAPSLPATSIRMLLYPRTLPDGTPSMWIVT